MDSLNPRERFRGAPNRFFAGWRLPPDPAWVDFPGWRGAYPREMRSANRRPGQHSAAGRWASDAVPVFLPDGAALIRAA
ncbi:hypothetical protein D9K77_12955 [Klebsiella pneumoniae]|nr:hypothetical protein D9K77_12955 [Klebsiella pneumoniae]